MRKKYIKIANIINIDKNEINIYEITKYKVIGLSNLIISMVLISDFSP